MMRVMIGDLVPGARGGNRSLAQHWLLDRYWIFAWGILLLTLPLVAWLGGAVDGYASIGYVLVTTAAWLLSRKRKALGARLHLLFLFPFWAGYASVEGALPEALGGTVGYAALLLFPTVTLTALEGRRGAVAALVLSVLGLALQHPRPQELAVELFLLSTGALIGLVFRKLVGDLELAREELRTQAERDVLTGVLNRRGLAALEPSLGEGGALLFLDLARFKTVNDVFGHVVGDDLLAQVSRRLEAAAGRDDVVARVGGDEFVVVARGRDEPDAARLAEALVGAVEAPFELANRAVMHVGAHVGIALWPRDGRTLTELMGASDEAMYRAKTRGLAHATADGHQGNGARRALEVELRRAIEGGELELHYQVVRDLENGRIAGAEALVRWNHPERGLLPPALFVELAEETGQIVQIDRFVMARAAEHLRAWRAMGLDLWVAVNVSARSLDHADFLPNLERLLEAQPELSGRLVVELTESAAMRDPELVVARLERLRELGVASAIDDFGMGYSSLAYLRRLPATHLKLDRAFTSGIGHHARDEEVIGMVLDLAQRLGLHVVAEGVEEDAQATWLTEKGCRFAQGFGIARPCDRESFTTLARRDSGLLPPPPDHPVDTSLAIDVVH